MRGRNETPAAPIVKFGANEAALAGVRVCALKSSK